ncbi:MAG TPA: HAMP domain-containing histidine kinase [Candidatus Kaiserbacteria bacterium]|nr:HAMP domain-containing histidine kinase [Candidatus Kaiserbacteria bacterium]
MTSSVEDFLNVSRIEQGRMKYDKTDFDMSKLAVDIVDELTPVAIKKNLKLSFKSDKEDSYIVNADLGKIKQVFSNLVDNSIKYTPKGSIVVSVSRNGEYVRFKVSDTGVGISKETLEKLFDKFVRARNAHNVNVTGSGLGLYVAKQMVKAHGGKIWAESEGEGKGSSFIVELKAL